jgi:hypothetical protein
MTRATTRMFILLPAILMIVRIILAIPAELKWVADSNILAILHATRVFLGFCVVIILVSFLLLAWRGATTRHGRLACGLIFMMMFLFLLPEVSEQAARGFVGEVRSAFMLVLWFWGNWEAYRETQARAGCGGRVGHSE